MKRELDDDRQGDVAEINLSPMIDCVFILLIFFIVTTVFVEETGIEVDKPTAASAQPLDKNVALIAISERDKVYYGGREIGVAGVKPMIRRALSGSDPDVVIQADAGASHGVFSRVYGEAKAAGAKRIHFSTED